MAEAELSAIESQPIVLSLTEGEASMLLALGRELASTQSWWGATAQIADRSVIAVDSQSANRYRVIFRDVVGTIRLGARQLQVNPKIPLSHFLYLASRSSIAPRISAAKIKVDAGSSLIEILALWTIDAAEELLRRGLRKDYQSNVDHLDEVRGRAVACETALNVLQGRAAAVCEFDELSDDAPLNRIVRGACQRIALLNAVSFDIRRRARHLVFRMDGIGSPRPGDSRTTVDRLTSSYTRVVPLSLLILAGCGLTTALGSNKGTTFLIRTPDLIEDGLRSVLQQALPEFDIEKRRLMLGESGLSMNPDLVFGHHLGVGDVKYRFLEQDWNRSDLNQLVAFATAFGTNRAVLLGFVREGSARGPRQVPVGPVMTSAFGWNASPDASPESSAAALPVQIRRWLS